MVQQPFRIVHRVVNGEMGGDSPTSYLRDDASAWVRKHSAAHSFTRLIGPSHDDVVEGDFDDGQFIVATLVAREQRRRLFSGKALKKVDWALIALPQTRRIIMVRGDVKHLNDYRLPKNSRPDPKNNSTMMAFDWEGMPQFNLAVYELTAAFASRDVLAWPHWENQWLYLLPKLDKNAFVDMALSYQAKPNP